MEANDITKIILGSFIIWYLLRRTNLGQAYATDMAAIPQQLSVAEGLKSAVQFVK
jgi:hypothetical protein